MGITHIPPKRVGRFAGLHGKSHQSARAQGFCAELKGLCQIADVDKNISGEDAIGAFQGLRAQKIGNIGDGEAII